MNNLTRTLAALMLTATAGTAGAVLAHGSDHPHTVQVPGPTVTVTPAPAVTVSPVNTELLPPCEYEDSDNCYWDAAVRGNGEGESFVVLDGIVYYSSLTESERSAND